jgi:glutamate racemase
MSAPRRIGVFDSGLGGLSVLQALKRRLPDASLLYVADSGFAPYGDKSADYVRARCLHIARFLISQQVDVLVIACNTATAAAATTLRAEVKLPVIAMEPGLKPAIANSRNGIIAVLATQGTLASQQFLHLRERFAEGVRVIDLPCPGWVQLVENGLQESAEAYQLVASTLSPVLDAGADTLVLGCTHFLFLQQAILAACSNSTQLIETSDAVAQQTARKLGELPEKKAGAEESLQQHFWSSGNTQKTAAIMSRLMGCSITVEELPEITATVLGKV